jgi:hypothetical protein
VDAAFLSVRAACVALRRWHTYGDGCTVEMTCCARCEAVQLLRPADLPGSRTCDIGGHHAQLGLGHTRTAVQRQSCVPAAASRCMSNSDRFDTLRAHGRTQLPCKCFLARPCMHRYVNARCVSHEFSHFRLAMAMEHYQFLIQHICREHCACIEPGRRHVCVHGRGETEHSNFPAISTDTINSTQ